VNSVIKSVRVKLVCRLIFVRINVLITTIKSNLIYNKSSKLSPFFVLMLIKRRSKQTVLGLPNSLENRRLLKWHCPNPHLKRLLLNRQNIKMSFSVWFVTILLKILWNVLFVLLYIAKTVMMYVKIINVVTAVNNLIYSFILKKSKFKMMSTVWVKIHHKNDINFGCEWLKIVGRWYTKECEMNLNLEIRLYIQDAKLMLYICDCTNSFYKIVYYRIMLNQYYMTLNHKLYI
jgi:hypothetical protein